MYPTLAVTGVRVAVEWMIGKLKTYNCYLESFRRHKVFGGNLAARMHVAVFLTNCHTILYGSQPGHKFDCDPPSLSEYTTPIFGDPDTMPEQAPVKRGRPRKIQRVAEPVDEPAMEHVAEAA